MIDVDKMHRTALLLAHAGAPTFNDALSRLEAGALIIVSDAQGCASRAGQAALITAVTTGVRAFGAVTVVDATDVPVIGGVDQGQSLHAVITREGAGLIEGESMPTEGVAIFLGDSPPTGGREGATLRASWTGWTARVGPGAGHATGTAGEDDCVLAAVAAAALAVGEAFEFTWPHPGSDAGYRWVTLNLWNPADAADESWSRLAYAPVAWWLVGLGHLGQSYAHVLSWLGYDGETPKPSVVLQDTDVIGESSHSTGVLTPAGASGLKTRHLAQLLEGAGFETSIIERRLRADCRAQDDEPHVALLGVDNLTTRRLISDVGWDLAIDVGLGRGWQDYTSIQLRRFPAATPSNAVPAWQETDTEITLPNAPAFREGPELDACGLLTMAGTAAGATFVGVTAACLAVAEVLRPLHDGPAFDVVTYDLLSAVTRAAPAASPTAPVARPLGP